jgi:autotransporter-associated beta strand protein
MNTATSRPRVNRTTLLAAAQLLYSVPLHGATGSWINNSTTGLSWPTAASWAGAVIPNGTGDVANFTNDITANRIIGLGGDKTVGALNIGDPATGFFAFTLNAGSPLNSTLIFDQTGVADATLTVPVVAGVAANGISAPYILLKDNLVVSTAFANSTTTQLNLSGIIRDDAGSFGITKTGDGIIQFAGPNSFKGGTILQAGRINSNNVRAFGSSGVTVQSGGQAFINTASIASNFSIAGTGYTNSADPAAQAGAIRFVNNRVVTGDVTVTAASRIGGDAAAVGFLDGTLAGSADLEINGPTTTTGGLTLLRGGSGFTGTLSLVRGSFQFNAGLGGSLSAAPVAAATMTLGTGTSLGGSLTLDSTAAPVTLRNVKGTLAITGNLSLTGATPVSLASTPPPGTGTLTLMTYASQSGAGSLTFDATGYRGSPTLAVGPAAATIGGLQGATRTWNNASTNGIWDAGTSANWVEGDNRFFNTDAVVFGNTAPGTITLAGTVAPHSATFTSTGINDHAVTGTGGIDGASGGIIKNGDAWLTLGGENTFTGGAASGIRNITLTAHTTIGAASGKTFDLCGDVTLGNLNTTNTNLAINNGFTIPGNLAKTGNGLVTLLGTVDVAGTVSVSGGILSLGNGGSGGSLGATAAITFSGIGPNLTINRSSDLAVPNLISGAGAFTKSGTGTVTLTADNSYSGNTTVNAGTLRINGTHSGTGNTNVASGGTLGGTFATVSDLPAGYALDYDYDNGVTTTNIALVKTGSPFGLWIAGFFPAVTDPAIVGPDADPDRDGQSNAMEFVLGGTPNNGSSNARIHPLLADSDDLDSERELILTLAIRVGTPAFSGSPSPAATLDGFTATVQGSLGLAGFTAPVTPVAPVTTGLPAAPAGYEYRSFSLAGSGGLPSKGFLRVAVTP